MKRRFISIGFFGAPNYGDELLSVAVRKGLERTILDSEVLTCTLRSIVSEQYSGIQSKDCLEGYLPSKSYVKTFRRRMQLISKSDLLIVGGGGLIADYYSPISLIRYSCDPLFGMIMGKSYVFAGVGARKLTRSWLKGLAGFFSRSAAAVLVRDPDSSAVMKELGAEKVKVGPDLSAIMYPFGDGETRSEYSIVNVRENPPIDDWRIEELVMSIVELGQKAVLLCAENSDYGYYANLAEKWSRSAVDNIAIVMPETLEEATNVILGADMVIAERLHVIAVAVMCQKKLGAIVYEKKVAEYLDGIGSQCQRASLSQVDSDLVNRTKRYVPNVGRERIQDMKDQALADLRWAVHEGLACDPANRAKRVEAAIWLLFALCVAAVWSIFRIARRVVCRSA
jgi:polysaccharide pyruvyl transferase WcaK-like protein